MLISSPKKKYLKARAHSLKPTVIIGQQGLTEAVHKEIEQVLNDHELIKIRINAENRIEKNEMATHICEQQQAAFIQLIGHILVIYRPSPNKKNK
ncbi:MAG: RNA-binding protein [Legionellaceae bacterium]